MISFGSISRLIMFEHDFAHAMLSGSAARPLRWRATRSLSLAGDSVGEVSRLTRLMGFSPGHAPPWVKMIRHKTYPARESGIPAFKNCFHDIKITYSVGLNRLSRFPPTQSVFHRLSRNFPTQSGVSKFVGALKSRLS